jgi:hypothetical protein
MGQTGLSIYASMIFSGCRLLSRPVNLSICQEQKRIIIGAYAMNENTERRREQRLRYQWPVWFAEDFGEALAQGQMVDISSGAAAFTCYADESCPYLEQHITARFSVPHLGPNDSFDMESFVRSGHICRVDEVNRFLRRVAIQFAEPLPFKPGEQAGSESDAQERLRFVTI